MCEAQVCRWVFDKNAPSERGLNFIDVTTDDAKRFFCHRQRKEVAEIGAADRAPRQVLGDEAWLHAFDHRGDTRKMCGIEAVGAAEREPHAVERERIIAPDTVEIVGCRAAAHVVLGMHLEPGDGGMCFERLAMMTKAQPDTRSRGNGAARIVCITRSGGDAGQGCQGCGAHRRDL